MTDAQEVDVQQAMEQIRDKGLDVVQEHAFAHLQALPDGSMGGVFAVQIIEHLHPERVIDFIRLCHRKLTAGAPLVLETPNPTCLMIFADSFYRDFTHVQPLHPDTMKFLLESIGLHEVEVRDSGAVDPGLRVPTLSATNPDLAPFNEAIERLNSLLFGFQDYAGST